MRKSLYFVLSCLMMAATFAEGEHTNVTGYSQSIQMNSNDEGGLDFHSKETQYNNGNETTKEENGKFIKDAQGNWIKQVNSKPGLQNEPVKVIAPKPVPCPITQCKESNCENWEKELIAQLREAYKKLRQKVYEYRQAAYEYHALKAKLQQQRELKFINDREDWFDGFPFMYEMRGFPHDRRGFRHHPMKHNRAFMRDLDMRNKARNQSYQHWPETNRVSEFQSNVRRDTSSFLPPVQNINEGAATPRTLEQLPEDYNCF